MDWTAITVGILTGMVSSAIVATVFYYLSGRDLAKEASELRKLNLLLIRALHNAGVIEVIFDDQGKPKGLAISVIAANALRLGESADVSVTRDSRAIRHIDLGHSGARRPESENVELMSGAGARFHRRLSKRLHSQNTHELVGLGFRVRKRVVCRESRDTYE